MDPKYHNKLLANWERKYNSLGMLFGPRNICSSVYTDKRMMLSHTQGGVIGARFGISTSGWMMQVTFIDWFKFLFVPLLPQKHPVVLILDGHDSCLTYNLHILAKENDVHLIKLPAHVTHILYSLDIPLFKSLKLSGVKCQKTSLGGK